MTPTDYKWTRIDPSVHTPEWFKGKAVTFKIDHNKGKHGFYEWSVYQGGFDWQSDIPQGVTLFLLHPPLPDPLEEEIEREAEAYSVSQIARQDWIKGARWGLRRGK